MSLGRLPPLVFLSAVLLMTPFTDGASLEGRADTGAAIPINADQASPAEPLLRFRVGDRFVYVNESHGLRVVMTVHEPVMAAAANLTKVAALPIVLDITAPDIQAREAYVMDLATGDLVISPDACLVDHRLSCSGGGYAGFQWGCPLDGIFGVASYVTMEDLDRSVIVLEDPVTGWRFPYSVERGVGTARFVLRESEVSDGKIICAQRSAVTVDLNAGIVVAMTVRPHVGGVNLTLAEWTPGDGHASSFSGDPSRASIFLPPETPRTEVYPPGYGRVGPSRWTVGESIARALEDHAPFAQWLEDHPDAFLYDSRLATGWSESLGIIRTDTFRWTLDVLSPEREMVRLVAEKELIQGLVERVRFDMHHVAVPSDVPPVIRPPSETGVAVRPFLDAMARHGYLPDEDELVNPILEAGFDETGDGAFAYFLILDVEETEPGLSLLLGFTFIPDTGRLGAGSLPLERARELVAVME